MSFLSEKSSSILMIILGIIAILFPMISTETIGFLSGIIFILIAVAFISSGIAELIITKYFGVIYLIFGILSLIAAYYLIFDPAFVSGLIGLIIYIFGFMLILLGIVGLFMGPFSIMGVITLIYGLVTLIISYYMNDPRILGTVVGIWLLISGIVSLFTDNKEYIDV
ncbi:MAG: hypothetical protein E7Z85_04865 [Methanosphaera stadtmanae]|nr:hypothetical protein [Methanosphaera stadtmanae]